LHTIFFVIRYLATGCKLTELYYNYRIGISTLSGIIQEACKAIWNNLKSIYMAEPTNDKWLDISEHFMNVTNFPNCLGAIDGKHIRIIKPAHSGSQYYNYKHFFSMVLLAVCDSIYCFTTVDIGDYGKNNDSSIFKNSIFFKKLIINKKQLNIPDDSLLPGTSVPNLPYVIVGDKAFGLSQHIMRPYAGKNITIKKRVFNYRLSRARRLIECSFGILSNKWRIFHRPLNVSENFAEDIIKACVILHNFVRIRDENTLTFEDTLSYQGFTNMNGILDNIAGKTPTSIRDHFADYFMDVGQVPWQLDSIQK